MKTTRSKPARAGLSFSALASIRPADLAPKPASAGAAARPSAWRLFLAGCASMIGLGKRAAPATVATTGTTGPGTAAQRPTRAAGPRPAPHATTATAKALQRPLAAPGSPPVTADHARRAAAAHAQGVAEGRAQVRERLRAVYDACAAQRDPAGMNLGVLVELAADPAMPVAQAVDLLMRLPAVPEPAHLSRASRNPQVGPGWR